MRWEYNRYAFPQQLPGPAQPAVDGDEPQQAVSPPPGKCWPLVPELDEWAESSLLRFSLLQLLQRTGSSAVITRISVMVAHSWHRYSNSGMGVSLGSLVEYCEHIPKTIGERSLPVKFKSTETRRWGLSVLWVR